MLYDKEILQELRILNKSIEYQTKLLEEIFMKKDEAKLMMEKKKAMMQSLINGVSSQLRAKGFDPAPFHQMVTPLLGDENEH